MEQISVIEHTNAELREHWGNLASNFLVGKTIRRVVCDSVYSH